MRADVLVTLIVHFATAAVLAFGLLRSLERVRVYSALLAGLLGYQLLAVIALSDLVAQFGIQVVATGEMAALAGAVILVGTLEALATLDRSFVSRRVGDVVSATSSRPFVYLGISLAIIVAILSISALRGSALFELNWEQARAESSFLTSVATLLLFVAFPCAYVLWRSRHFGLAGFALLIAVSLTAVYGSRAALLTLPAVIALDMLSRGVFTRNARTLVLVGLGILGLVTLFHVTGRLIRGFGLAGLIALARGESLSAGEAGQLLSEIDWTGGESDIFEYFFFVVGQSSIPGVEAPATLWRWLLMYLPRSLVEGFKPLDPTYALWTHAANSGLFEGEGFIAQVLDLLSVGDSGSIHPTFWGEAWMNGRWLGIVVMCMALAVTVHLLERLYVLLRPAAAVLCLPAAVVGYLMVARGNSTIGLGYIAYLLPVAVLAVLSASAILRTLGIPSSITGDVGSK